MSFFFSSPLKPTFSQTHRLPHEQSLYFTPQTHKIVPFSEPAVGPYPQFQPKSPSPLRPSWNAGNVMRQQAYDTKANLGQNTWNSEQVQQENHQDKIASFATQTNPPHNPGTAPQASSPNTNTNPAPANLFTTLPTTQNNPDPNPTRNPFQYRSTSQTLRPTSQINSRIRNNRDARRTLFLDRLRTSRRDERDNNIIERFEKEEYWRERKRREERMLREAEAEVELDWDDEDVDYLDVEDEEQVQPEVEAEMSPLDEDAEVGELVNGWYEYEGTRDNQIQQGLNRQDDNDNDYMDAHFDFEDSDVEEAFMQVLSQQEQEPEELMVQGQGQLQRQQELISPRDGSPFAFGSIPAEEQKVHTMGQDTNVMQEKDTEML